ncbi:hypothetical protein [Kushneria phosphatilytica]|uniref:Uncharacterized protein n=1 Tax=Kushneria phosphatilytica TaxID=657387 RepID=A0A1S1NUS0_9GAMM|nr:hypothetical protein [Kushneria phosphatilytica]OHV07507.1 hypothetical protein BH688_14845 [Kushneria phosphatilytica]QEL09989.1 hypothetical protein FY550_01800 [Kushneria phosphatilytica]
MSKRFEVIEHTTSHIQGDPNREQNQGPNDMPLESFRIYDQQQQQYVGNEYDIREEAEEDCQRMNQEAGE